MIILWLVKSGITMLSHNKDDNQFVSEFPSFLEHPVLWQISIHKSGLLLKLLSFRKRFDVSDVFIPILMYLTFLMSFIPILMYLTLLMFLYQSWCIWSFWCFSTNLYLFDASDVFIPILIYLTFLMFFFQSWCIWRFFLVYISDLIYIETINLKRLKIIIKSCQIYFYTLPKKAWEQL